MIAILLSGGIGSRMKTEGMPKQYLPLCGRPILLYSLQTFDRHPAIMGAVIVADVAWRDLITAWMEQNGITKFVAFADHHSRCGTAADQCGVDIQMSCSTPRS